MASIHSSKDCFRLRLGYKALGWVVISYIYSLAIILATFRKKYKNVGLLNVLMNRFGFSLDVGHFILII